VRLAAIREISVATLDVLDQVGVDRLLDKTDVNKAASRVDNG